MLPSVAAVFCPPLLAATPPYAHRLVRALRVAAAASGGTSDPQVRLIELLGSAAAASGFRLLLAGMAHVWPDPLTVFRPCCPHLTHDEQSFLAMVAHAASNDRRAFDRQLGEMITQDARDWLFVTAARFVAVSRA
jgi:hypothetical protein